MVVMTIHQAGQHEQHGLVTAHSRLAKRCSLWRQSITASNANKPVEKGTTTGGKNKCLPEWRFNLSRPVVKHLKDEWNKM